MAGRFANGVFKPKNPDKYIGRGTIRYRSSWELSVFLALDQHPSVEAWASESLVVKYKDPITNKLKNYIPDLFVIYKDKNGIKKAEIIEIKPSGQTGQFKPKNLNEAAVIAKNQAKWQAGMAYAAKNGIGFRVVTEHDLFGAKK